MTTFRRNVLVLSIVLVAAVAGYCWKQPRCKHCPLKEAYEKEAPYTIGTLRQLELVQTEILLRQKGKHGTSPFARSLRRYSDDALMAAAIRARAIYGRDNRVDPSDRWFLRAAIRRNVSATAAIIDCTHFEPPCEAMNVAVYRFHNPKTVEQNQICCEERFHEQISAARCTAFLISSTEVVTARHCVDDVAQLARSYFVFDFKKSIFGRVPMEYTYGRNLFKPAGGPILQSCPDDKLDWAIVKLDRSVPAGRPFVTLGNGAPPFRAPLYAIGYPLA